MPILYEIFLKSEKILNVFVDIQICRLKVKFVNIDEISSISILEFYLNLSINDILIF